MNECMNVFVKRDSWKKKIVEIKKGEGGIGMPHNY